MGKIPSISAFWILFFLGFDFLLIFGLWIFLLLSKGRLRISLFGNKRLKTSQATSAS